MKVIDKTIKELSDLDPDQALNVFNYILSVKEKQKRSADPQTCCDAYLEARKALKSCSGSLSSDIIADREERI